MKKPDILALRPSQFSLGMKEVDFKIAKMRRFKMKELKSFCDDHVIPIVVGPKHEMYVIDHHHFARACWELNVDSYSVKVVKNLSDKSEKAFWEIMRKHGWTYLHDQFGFGPHSTLSLPIDIRCMSDDPYRSLVWALINEGHIEKHPVPFYEFYWAEYFRAKLKIDLHGKSDFDKATQKAVQLARSDSARHLLGHISAN